MDADLSISKLTILIFLLCATYCCCEFFVFHSFRNIYRHVLQEASHGAAKSTNGTWSWVVCSGESRDFSDLKEPVPKDVRAAAKGSASCRIFHPKTHHV